jgi:voltage-gated potassium channel Kch
MGSLSPAPEAQRKGVVVVGATPLARELSRRLTELGETVALVDSHAGRCAAASDDGLTCVLGDGSREVVLFEANAQTARWVLAATGNELVDARIGRIARSAFRVPDVAAWRAAGGASAVSITPELADHAALEAWEDRAARREVRWLEEVVRPGEDAAAVRARVHATNGALPLLVARAGELRPLHAGSEVRPGDVIHALAPAREERAAA